LLGEDDDTWPLSLASVTFEEAASPFNAPAVVAENPAADESD
jgi:hypothetical protein